MKLPRKDRDETSATITQTLCLMAVCSLLFALTAIGSPPAWWSSRGAVLAPVVTTNDGVVTTNYVADDYAAITQGQLKQFTARAVDELNANLTGGAGTNLNTMVSNWASDYTTNGYNATNIKPSDYDAISVGQLKYIGNKVWNQLVTAGYTSAAPTWLALNTNSDNQAANLGQLKQVFDFSLSSTTAATPTFSPGAGTYTSPQTVTISSSTSSSTIYYTTDGSTPTTSSSSFASGGTVSVTASETLKAFAAASGHTNSSVVSASYTIETAAATPTFSPGAGTYTSSQTVTISSSTSGATIYYTTDGSTPTTSSSSFASGGTVSVTSSETVKALAAASGYTNSSIASATYTIETAAVAPTFSPGAGTYTSSQTVTISSSTSSSTIYYTTDGSTPTTSSSSFASGGTVSVTASETLKALAAASGYTNSSVASASYTIETAAVTPTFSPGAGTYTSAQTVTVSSSTSGATIYYTTDGSTPTTGSSSFASGGTVNITSSETLKAFATATGHTNSSVASAAYTIETAVVTPTFSLAAGTYMSSQTVAISSSTSGATIYYTTDGSTPTTSSSSFASGGTVSVTASETLKAFATATGYTNSSVASASYTIETAAATPTFSPGGGIYTSGQTVTLSSSTSGATIYYTTDGSTPTTGSSSVTSGGTVSVSASETLEAIAVATGSLNSSIASAGYTIQTAAATPTFSPGAGTYALPQVVTVSSATPDATIFYTTDGSTPTTDSLSVASGETITVGANETLKAIAVAIGFNDSSVLSGAYVITSPNAPPGTGLTMWLKADAGVTNSGATPSPGGNVDTWTDQEGSYTATQSSTGNQPIYIPNCINGMPALRFSGNQWLFNSSNIGSSEDADMTMITVCSTSAPTIQEYALWLGTANEGNPGGCRSVGYASSVQFFDASYDPVSAASVPPSGVFTAEAISINSSVNQVTFYRNGIQTSSPGLSGMQNLNGGITVGAQTFAGGNDCDWQGDIAEVLIYDHQLSSSEMAQVSEYLSGKYGLLYNAAPTVTPAAGSYTSSQTVSISSPLTGVIHYTLDGSVPTIDSPTYTGSFTISNSALVQAAVFIDGETSSALASVQYYINDTSETGLPITPTGLTATSISGSETDLAWTLSGTVNYGAINIYRSTGGGAYVLIATLDPSATSYADQNIVGGDSYTYEVGTVNTAGISDSSASSSITAPTSTALTITVTTPSGAVALP